MADSAISLCSALGAVMFTTSISRSATSERQSDVAREKPKAAAAFVAASSLMSAIVRSSSSKGRSKPRAAVVSPKPCALPMKPLPMRPMRSFGLVMSKIPVHDEIGVDPALKEVDYVLNGRHGHPLRRPLWQVRDVG